MIILPIAGYVFATVIAGLALREARYALVAGAVLAALMITRHFILILKEAPTQ